MIVLDTNILSEVMRAEPDEKVLEWLDAQVSEELVITSITVAEILYGLARLPKGKRKSRMQLLAEDMFNEDFADAILPFDATAARFYATLVSGSEAAGRAISMADAQIAAICSSHKARLATRNLKDFEHLGLNLINPFVL